MAIHIFFVFSSTNFSSTAFKSCLFSGIITPEPGLSAQKCRCLSLDHLDPVIFNGGQCISQWVKYSRMTSDGLNPSSVNSVLKFFISIIFHCLFTLLQIAIGDCVVPSDRVFMYEADVLNVKGPSAQVLE